MPSKQVTALRVSLAPEQRAVYTLLEDTSKGVKGELGAGDNLGLAPSGGLTD